MGLLINSNMQYTSPITNTSITNDKNSDSDIPKKNSSGIIKIREGNNYCMYSVDENGKKTLIAKIKIPSGNTDSNKSTDWFKSDNPLFSNQNVISTARAAFDYNQQILQQKNHVDDNIRKLIKEIQAIS